MCLNIYSISSSLIWVLTNIRVIDKLIVGPIGFLETKVVSIFLCAVEISCSYCNKLVLQKDNKNIQEKALLNQSPIEGTEVLDKT